MLRICLCLLILAASSSVVAREAMHNSPGSSSCPDKNGAEKAAAPATSTPRTAPAQPAKGKPSVHGDAPSGVRLQSPRWHSFLPGMIR